MSSTLVRSRPFLANSFCAASRRRCRVWSWLSSRVRRFRLMPATVAHGRPPVNTHSDPDTVLYLNASLDLEGKGTGGPSHEPDLQDIPRSPRPGLARGRPGGDHRTR